MFDDVTLQKADDGQKLKLVIDNAQQPAKTNRKPSQKSKPTEQASTSKPDSQNPKNGKANPRYVIDEEGRICKPDSHIPKPLCNFKARIMTEVLHDNGDEIETFFLIEAKLANNKRTFPGIEIPAANFAGMAWVTAKLGACAIVYAGSSNRDQLRDAIQELSEDITQKTVYTHTGWRCLDGDEWRYLHGGGSIGADGNHEGTEVNPGEQHMRLYRLPSPPKAEELGVAIRASLELAVLAPNVPELGDYLLAAVFRTPTGEAAPIDHGGWLYGSTGNFKSEAAALALAFFGEFDGRHIPSNFTDSTGGIERKTHAAKDALMVVDDFKPLGGANDVNKLHAKADAIFRGVGNQSGRSTLTANRKERAALYPRCFVLATGEDLPRNQSCRARLTVIELAKGDIDRAKLSQLQKSAMDGLFRQVMSAYLQWLAPQMAELKKKLPGIIRSFRERALSLEFATAHARTASDYASLRAGLCLFAEFIMQTGAIPAKEIADFEERAEKSLQSLMTRQSESQGEEDEVKRFFALVYSALSAGRCHVSDKLTQGPPNENPFFWGWLTHTVTHEDKKIVEHLKPQGQCIGWTDKDNKELCLDGEATYAVTQAYAREQGRTIEIGKNTLWKRIKEKGLLARTTRENDGREKPQVRVKIGGVPKWLYVLSARDFKNEELYTS
ncbi:MAG: hypothetical protein ACOYMG_06860 [Candidatus Methylumidiphilus sp.]